MFQSEIQVVTTHAQPIRFRWKRQWYSISSIEDDWVDTGEWWNGEGEKTFYRVFAGDGVFEIYYDEKEKAWHMYRVYD